LTSAFYFRAPNALLKTFCRLSGNHAADPPRLATAARFFITKHPATAGIEIAIIYVIMSDMSDIGNSEINDVTKLIRQRFAQSAEVIEKTAQRHAERIARAAEIIVRSLRAGGTVFTFGNGGSASDAEHIAGELVGRFLAQRPPLRAEALSADIVSLTAIGNDYGYKNVFARPLAAKGRAGDVAIALSTSGKSPNVIAALRLARQMGLKTIALTGDGGGGCAELADILLDVPAKLSPRIQEAHAAMYHIICELVEANFTTPPKK